MKAATARNIALKVEAKRKMEDIYKAIRAQANRGYREATFKEREFHKFADEILAEQGYVVKKNKGLDYYSGITYSVSW